MTDTKKESHYQDRADTLSENAKLRAEVKEAVTAQGELREQLEAICSELGKVGLQADDYMGPDAGMCVRRLGEERDKLRAELDALHAAIEDWHNGYDEGARKAMNMQRPATHIIALRELRAESCELDGPDLKRVRAELESVKKREKDGVELFDGIVAELRADLAEARKSLDALRAAPSDAEIEEWRKGVMECSLDEEPDEDIERDAADVGTPKELFAVYRRELDDAVALMRRANAHRPAPAASAALREAAKALVERLDFVHQHPAYKGVWMNDWAHGGRYDGPTYNREVDALRAALAAAPEAQPQPSPHALRLAVRDALVGFRPDEQGMGTAWFKMERAHALRLLRMVTVGPSDLEEQVAALKAQPATAVPEDVRHLAEEFDRFDRMVPGSDECRVSSGRNLVRAILSLPAGAAPQPETRADGECEVAGGAERVCERGTQDCITLHTPLPGSGAGLQRMLDDLHATKGGSPEWCGHVEAFISWLARKVAP